MINLYISLYAEKNANRREELNTCLQNNLNSECFDNIFVLGEKGYPEELNNLHTKICVLPCTVRPTLRTFFEAVNTITKDDDVNIIANSDIYFEEIPVLPKVGQCFALSRYEVVKNGPIRFEGRKDSQDSFFFRGKIRIPKYCDGHLGIPGVDNRFCWEMMNVGYEVLNPSLTIKSYHLHAGAKSYDRSVTIPRPYHFVSPIELNQ